MHYSTLLGAAAVAALSGGANASPLVRRAPETGVVIEQCTQPGVVALTYDDGPFTFTPQLLDILKQNDVKATFFINGQNWGNIDTAPNPDTIRRMHAEGHQIGSHTYSHANLEQSSTEVRRTEMTSLEEATRRIAGIAPRYMRVPYLDCGAACLQDLKDLNYVVVGTNLDTKDYENNKPETTQISADKFNNELLPTPETSSFIVLSHDVHEQTVVSLTKKMIDTIKAKGYRTVTVGECLGETDPNSWYKN
ncbi:Chitin deacetylase-like protein 5 [Colletotrichum truncatum]|uniref:Chitin deacetylase-like protein 5 n=1 Tax=Colletotrichum truncatum TaxID=5467 RepID=A0ACC3YHH8_COLTU|nr:Chitin deacetylase-like protein 5 [Colletotrichum truncatum]KAF6792886.1 Chitin deacetylase-like protein 5 [Colletotrichum truncatum]